MPSDRCLSCPVLSETLVYCGQTVEWIKVKLGMQVGLGPGHIHCVRCGPRSPSPKGAQPPNYRPISVVAKWLYRSRCHLVGSRPRCKRHCVRWGPSSPSQKGAEPPVFGQCLLWPNGCMDQDATWYGGRPWLRPHCARWVPSSHSLKGGTAFQFSAHVCCG